MSSANRKEVQREAPTPTTTGFVSQIVHILATRTKSFSSTASGASHEASVRKSGRQQPSSE